MSVNDEALSGIEAGADVYHRIDTAKPLSVPLVDGLNELCERVEASSEDTIAVLHLTDESDAGPGGTAWPGEVGIELVNRWERALRRLERLRAVTVSVAEGRCAGPALEVLLTTDYRIATRDLRLHPPALSGEVWPGMVLHRLANQIGTAQARRLALFGGEVTAVQARRVSLIDEIVDDVVEGVAASTQLAGVATGTELGIRRRLMMEATSTSYEEALGAHLAACDRSLRRARREPDPDAAAVAP